MEYSLLRIFRTRGGSKTFDLEHASSESVG
jgi:hypothetical protein